MSPNLITNNTPFVAPQTIGVLNKNAKSLEQCQDIRRREKRLKNVINERQKSIVDSLEKMAETVGS